jgi:VWFA-related protein
MKVPIALAIAVVLGSAATFGQTRSAPPTFRAGVDLVAVDVQVVTSDGLPVTGLGPDRFEVSINGRRRRVVSAELVRHDIESAATMAPTNAPTTANTAATSGSVEGRVYVIAIDVLSFQAAATRPVAEAAGEFVRKLQPSDRVGLAAFPSGPHVDATTDHAAVLRGLEQVIGSGDPPGSAFNRFGLNPSNVVDLTAAKQREPHVPIRDPPPNTELGRKVDEVCAYDRDPAQCRLLVVVDAEMMGLYEEGLAVQRLGALRGMLGALARSAGRKTIVLFSAGLPATDIPGGRPDLGDLGLLVGQEAARANSTIYSVHVDTRRMAAASASSGARPRPTDNVQRDSAILSRPLDQVAGLSGGALFTVVQGGGEFAFDRIRRETSSLYLLGVEPDESDRTGEPRRLTVRVNGGPRGTTTRAGSWVVVPKSGATPEPARARSAPASSPPRIGTPAPTPEETAAYERLWGERIPAPTVPVSSASTSAASAARRTPTPFDALYDEYASGQGMVVLDRFRTVDDFERYRPDMIAALADWKKAWSPRRAAFAMEIALTAFVRRWPNPQMFLEAARNIVIGRPDAPGTRPDDDRFELRFHRAAVAMLAAVDGPHGVDSYLASIQHRVVLSSTPPKDVVKKNPMLKDSRLVMAQAMAREVQTLMLLLSVGSRRDDPRTWVVSKDDTKTRRQLDEVGQLLELAAADEETRAEASVRRAFILHRLGANPEALALLDAPSAADEVVDYWRALIRARVLLALGRQQDAIASFERAAMFAPDAQTPAVALMALFVKLGDREQALGWAERARTTTENRGDPWPQYWSGSTRFLAQWLADLREDRR